MPSDGASACRMRGRLRLGGKDGEAPMTFQEVSRAPREKVMNGDIKNPDRFDYIFRSDSIDSGFGGTAYSGTNAGRLSEADRLAHHPIRCANELWELNVLEGPT